MLSAGTEVSRGSAGTLGTRSRALRASGGEPPSRPAHLRSLLIAFYYALTGVACAVYYRRHLTESVR
ncbi:hypothetical protein, partial [Streptomyces microflavus]|uniref:hypothetical protein n=1 Tax=Streptomyces microflavus TaxID=1919 RepID=UPI0033D81CD7